MGFVRDVAKTGMFGLPGMALGSLLHKKKKPMQPSGPQSSMISSAPSRPTSMIGGRY